MTTSSTLPSEPRSNDRGQKSRDDAGSQAKVNLTMVDSMAPQTVGSRRLPSLSVHSDSSGGGAQMNIFTKLLETQSTLMFKVDSEQALIEAYRHVRAMNPSAPVWGILFGVAPKMGTSATEVSTVD
ncbi:hypothetical protein ACJ41O_013263 [Fusarium nematophilum]